MNSIIHLKAAGEAAAVLVTEISHRHHSMYKVTFESGYTNIFFTDVETGNWVEEDLGFTALAALVGKEIKDIKLNPIHIPKALKWDKILLGKKLVSFGFCYVMDGEHRIFELYHSNKKYMFTLVEKTHEDWEIMGLTDVTFANLDPFFMQEIIKVLPRCAFSD